MPSEDQKKVTVEDLLRLKRSERPDNAFWGDFDRELHQRMLQTLVRKDPWYVHAMRGLTGKMAQAGLMAAAAALVGIMVVRPALMGPDPASSEDVVSVEIASSTLGTPAAGEDVRTPTAVAASISSVLATVERAPVATELSYRALSNQAQSREYGIDRISAHANLGDFGFRREFEADSMQVASYDRVAYSADAADARSPFANPGVASLVY